MAWMTVEKTHQAANRAIRSLWEKEDSEPRSRGGRAEVERLLHEIDRSTMYPAPCTEKKANIPSRFFFLIRLARLNRDLLENIPKRYPMSHTLSRGL